MRLNYFFKIHMNQGEALMQFKQVQEASYLTAEKAWSYRAILRYFYIQHERMREFLFPEEIYEHVKSLPGFEDYTQEQLHQDLDQLVRWNNLHAIQETGKARTIEEFKKKRFRYQCTPYTVEFERMLVEMEADGETFGGSLEKKEFERLYQTLYELEKLLKRSSLPERDECAQIWNDLFTYFRSIKQNTSDYIAHINSEEAEERMQTEAFLVFKDQFISYLRDFIIELQQTASKIQQVLQSIDQASLQSFVKQVIIHRKQVPRFEDLAKDDEDLLQMELGKWESLKVWFLGNQHGESELEMLEIRTNEQIRRITRIVQRLGERHQYFRNRKKDYLHLAKWFSTFSDIKEAHKLSAVVFGVFHTKHIFSDHVPTENIYTSVWEEKPIHYETSPRTRNYREKTRPSAIVSQKAEKERTILEHLQRAKQEQTTLENYMKDNEIHVEQLPIVEPYVRKILLNWIGKAMNRKDKTFQTEFGHVVKMKIDPSERIVLRATDGELDMPKVVFQFTEQ